MPKYNVETKVTYRFQVEAPNQLDTESLGTDFEEYNWELELEIILWTSTFRRKGNYEPV